jgi:peptidyl-prolyl cis-trans isomerase C
MRKMKFAGAIALWFFGLPLSWAWAQDKEPTQGDNIPPVVAKVNGKEISADKYQAMVSHLQTEAARGQAQGGQAPPSPQDLKEAALDRLITAELLKQEATQKGMKADPKQVEQRIQEVEQRMGGKEKFEALLTEHGLTMADYRADVLSSMEIDKLLKQEVYDKVTLTPKEVRAYYDGNPNQFKAPERVRASHILIKVPPDADETQKKEAKAAIQAAAERIRKGDSFEEVAKEVSQDGSASKGGDLGYFERGRMVPEFEEVAFSLDKGQVSDVVVTKFGYHLIKVEDKRPAGIMSYDEVENTLTDYLKFQKTEAIGQKYIDSLKAEAKIEKTSF